MIPRSQVPRYVQTKEPGLVRDTQTRALLTTDLQALERSRKQQIKQRQTEETHAAVANLQAQYSFLNEQVNTMTHMMQQMMELIRDKTEHVTP